MRKSIYGAFIFVIASLSLPVNSAYAVFPGFPATVKSITGRDSVYSPFPKSKTEAPAMCPLLVPRTASYYDQEYRCQPTTQLSPWPDALPMYPFSSPVKSFAGRYLDGAGPYLTIAWRQFNGGNPILVNSAKGRLYMKLGDTLAVYNMSTFFSRIKVTPTIAEPMKFFGRKAQSGNYQEALIPWDDYFYPDEGASSSGGRDSGWELFYADIGQTFFDVDADDRGYLYLTVPGGWGIIKDDGQKFRAVSEALDGDGRKGSTPYFNSTPAKGSNKIIPNIGGIIPTDITSFKAGSSYYLAGTTSGNNSIVIYDVTDPLNPRYKGEVLGSAQDVIYTKSGTKDIVAVIDQRGNFSLYDAAAFADSDGPAQSPFTVSGSANERLGYRAAAADPATGKIYALGYGLDSQKDSGLMTISVFAPTAGGGAATYTETRFETVNHSIESSFTQAGFTPRDTDFTATKLNYNNGSLVSVGQVYGNGQNSDVKIWTFKNAKPEELNLDRYFLKHYSNPPENYVRPATSYSQIINAALVSYGGKMYIFVSTYGQGDVYELDLSGAPITDNGCAPGNVYSTTTGNPCTCVINQLFNLGDRGENVRAFQQVLREEGFYRGNIDGVYGPLSSAAAVARCTHESTPPTFTASTPPEMDDVEGPRSLSVNQQGTWTARATDQNKDNLSWSVDWGSGKSAEVCEVNPRPGTSLNWSYTATHSWITTGTRTVTFYVTDCKGGSAKNSFTVSVH